MEAKTYQRIIKRNQMRKCNKCATIIEQKAKQLFCYNCKGYKLPYETYKFYSLANQFNNK